MKNLSDLHKDGLSCERLFDFVFNKGKITAIEYNEQLGQLTLSGSFYCDLSRVDPCKMFIWDDGSVFLEENGEEVVVENIFALVDFIRELGYEPMKV